MYEENISVEEVQSANPQNSPVVNEKPRKKFKWKKFLEFFFLGLIVLGIGYLGYRFYAFKPYRVVVSNVTSRSATISWVTDNAEPGMVVYKEGNAILPVWVSKYGMGTGYDDRDYSDAELGAPIKTIENVETEVIVTEKAKYWSHHVTIRNLKPETEYEFMIGDGLVFEKANTVDTENNIVTTLQEDDEIRTPIPAYGVVRYYDDEDELYIRSVDAIVYVILKENLSGVEAQTISSSMNMDGGWYVDLSTAVTSSGENFWDALGDVEVSDVNLELIIENVGFGRWLKTISILQSTPADTIDLSADKAEDNNEGLKYQGMSISYNGKSILQNLRQKTYAKALFEGEDNTTYVVNVNTKTYKEDAVQILEAGKVRQATLKKSKEPEDKYTSTFQSIVENLTDIVDQGNSSGSSVSGGEETILNDAYIQEARGDCGTFDVCEPEKDETLQCGWFNNASCNCVCPNETVYSGVEWGGTCSCDSSGNAVITKRDSSVTTTIDQENWIAKIPANICPNNIVNPSADDKYTCLSSNGCWYSAGYYSRRTYADTGYTCTKTDDGWRWAGDGVTYVDELDTDKSEVSTNGVCCQKGEDMKWLEEADTCTTGWNPVSGKNSLTCDENYSSEEEGKYSCWLGKTQGYWLLNSIASQWGGHLEQDTSITDSEECKKSRITPESGETKGLTETGCYENSETGNNLVAVEDNVVYKCKNGEWIKASLQTGAEDGITADGSCSKFGAWDRTIINGKLYECNWVKHEGYQWVLSTKVTDEYALKIKTDKTNDYTCPSGEGYEKCLCKYTITSEYDYCDDSYYTAKYGNASCKGTITVPKEELLNPGETCPKNKTASVLGIDTKSKVLAQSTNDKYILDTNTGIIQGFKPGLYSFEYNGDTYMINISEEDYEANDGKFVIYLDKDGNGEIDEATEALTDEAVILTLTVETEGFTYSLKEGFNFISLPFVISEGDVTMASELIELLNYKYDNAFYSISKYESGKWVIVGSNGGTYNQNDFQLIPGQGYVLKTKMDVNVTLYGHEVTYESSNDSAPIRFMPGWNLVGLYGTNIKSYTAESILQDITNYDPIDFTAVNVSRWSESRALYEALQRDEDSTVYGLDFPIELKRSYFIKVTEGSGNWEPGIQ